MFLDVVQRVLRAYQVQKRPRGMSRRGFLRAIGQTAMISVGAAALSRRYQMGVDFASGRDFMVYHNHQLQQPEFYYMSHVGDPTNWDYSPAVIPGPAAIDMGQEQLEAGRLAFMNRMAADLSTEAVMKRQEERGYLGGTLFRGVPAKWVGEPQEEPIQPGLGYLAKVYDNLSYGGIAEPSQICPDMSRFKARKHFVLESSPEVSE